MRTSSTSFTQKGSEDIIILSRTHESSIYSFCRMIVILVLIFAHQSSTYGVTEEYNSPWHYKCESGQCRKNLITDEITVPMSLGVCQLTCTEYGGLWPKPTGHMSLSNNMVQLNPYSIEMSGIEVESIVGSLLQRCLHLLRKNLQKLCPNNCAAGSGANLIIHFSNTLNPNDAKLSLTTNESYTLEVYQVEDGKINATITANTYFGARHAVETLRQLIVYDELRGQVQTVRDAYVADGPMYPYRGVLLDTSRNFIDKASILRTIEAMSMSKLNTFHWHITDSHSFPYVSATWPKMSKYGAYDYKKVYTPDDVKEIVHFGLIHGVRVLPEFDAPAHVGEGWQWVGDNATVCFKAEPWQSYCVEPPCGQLNPTSEKVYEILEGIYSDMIRDFKPDIFHMGGDEVNVNCWNSSEIIKTWMIGKGWNLSESSFYRLWHHFQNRALDKLKLANKGNEMPVILWTSGLTSEENIGFLDPTKYIIQIWTTGTDPTVSRLLKNNFNIIFSNYDALYLDCGFGAWVGEGNNWCSPYKGWQVLYENSPLSIVKHHGYGDKKHLIQGGETALWTEQADGMVIDSRLWPRSAAFAEILWSEPTSGWIHAEQRMLRQRERLVDRGILADTLQPEWCWQNQGHCYL